MRRRHHASLDHVHGIRCQGPHASCQRANHHVLENGIFLGCIRPLTSRGRILQRLVDKESNHGVRNISCPLCLQASLAEETPKSFLKSNATGNTINRDDYIICPERAPKLVSTATEPLAYGRRAQ